MGAWRRWWRAREEAAFERDIRDELEFHVEMRTRENLARGMPFEAARAEAERRLSGREAIQAQMREIGRSEARRRWRTQGWGEVFGDARHGVRSLARRPLFTVVAVLTLGLGIGATTAIFSLANRLLLRGVPGLSGTGGLVTVTFERNGGRFLISHPDYEDLARSIPAFESLAASLEVKTHVAGPVGPARRLTAELITSNYAATLQLRGVTGRVPVVETGEDARIVMISDRLQREQFGASRGPGASLTINGRPFAVVGVAPAGYRGPATLGDVDLWIPIEAHRDVLVRYPTDLLTRRDRPFWLNLYGRLAPSAGVEEATAQLRWAADRIVEEHPESPLRRLTPTLASGIGLTPAARTQLEGTVRIMGVVVVFLLVLTCANCANLLLVRGSTRTQEISVRRALGASRGRLMRQLLTEALVLGLIGGTVGLALAVAGLRLFDGERMLTWLPPLTATAPDARVLTFAVLLSLATGALFGIVPAFVSVRRGESALRSVRVAPGRDRLRTVLVVAQVAISLALLVGAGLLLDTVRALRRIPLGFSPADVVELSVDPATQGYDDAARVRFFRDLLVRARALPGVAAAGLSFAPIHGQIAAGGRYRPEGASPEDPRTVSASANSVSAGFLAAAGLTLLDGRDFRDDEVLATSPPARGVVLVSASVARQLFPEGGAVGRVIDAGWDEPRPVEIVGVFADARLRDPREPGDATVLEPAGQSWALPWATVYARSPHDVAGATSALRSIVRELDASLPVYDVQPLTRRLDGRLAAERMLARVTTLFAALALTLAAVGLYGVLAYSVEHRTREFGVRLALGADPRRIRAMVLREGLVTAGFGIAIGCLAATQVGRLISTRLFGVSPFDPLVFGAAATVLLAVATLASWIPAWRATHGDPLGVLRVD